MNRCIIIWASSREKNVFEVSDKASFKPVSSATETSLKIEISLVASVDMILLISECKDADQSARMRRLVCAFVVRKPPKTGLLSARTIYFQINLCNQA